MFISKAYAAGITNPALTNGIVAKGAGADSVGKIISGVIGLIFFFSMILGFIHLIFGSFQWITAGGDKTKLENARNRIVEAIIGMIILASVWAVMRTMATFLGLGEFPFFNLPEFY